ncbi:MAG: oligosaccharide flippase family protein, partial [Alphaproteobacteria bacterium]|nr:oligosaccharide flippase family protein [Alphaproteobacteria bacterium]
MTDTSAPKDAAPAEGMRATSLRGSAALASAQIVQIVLHYGAIIVMARLLTPADYGIIAMLAPIKGLLTLLRRTGFSDGVVQSRELTNQHLINIFWINVAVALVFAGVLAATAPAISAFYDQPALVDVALVYAAVLLISTTASQHVSIAARSLRFDVIAKAQLVGFACGLVVGIATAWWWRNYWALVAMQVTMELVEAAYLWVRVRWVPGRPRRAAGSLTLLRFGGSTFSSRFMAFSANNAPHVIIGAALGEVALGLFDRAHRMLSYPMGHFHRAIGRVANSVLSRLQTEHERYLNGYFTIVRLSLLAMAPGIVAIGVYADRTVLVLLGDQWLATAPVFALLAPLTIVQMINDSTNWLLFSQGRGRALMAQNVIRLGVVVGAIFAGLPFGLIGVAVAYSVGLIVVMTPVTWWIATKSGPLAVGRAAAELLPMAVALAVTAAALYALRGPTADWPLVPGL